MKNRIITILAGMAALLGAVLCASGCQEKGPESAWATLLEFAAVDVPAKAAPATEVKVYSDGNWSVISCPEWVTVTPAAGSGHATVTLNVSDNVTGGEVDLPRTGVLVIGGERLIGQASLAINQGGDRYAGVAASALSAVKDVKDGEKVHVKKAQAVAATASQVLVSDGTGFALTDAPLLVGQSATVKGEKSYEKGIVRITNADLLDIVDGTAPTPAATPVENPDEFAGNAYVVLEGVVGTAGSSGDFAFSVPGATRSVTVLAPLAALDFASISHHLAAVTGYGFVDGNNVYLVATEVEDKGAAMMNDVLARWLFNDTTRDKLGPLFTGKAESEGNIFKSDNVKDAGDDGKYVPAEEGDAKLTYNCIDKNEIDVNGAFTRLIGKTGEPYVTGAYAGDFWEFDVTLAKTYKAGSTVHFFGIPRSSNGSLKYWTLEILDGGDWKPMLDLLEKEVDIDANGTKGMITYNCEQVGDGYLDVDANYVLTADLSGHLRIRYRAMANMTASASSSRYKGVPDGGTHRFAGNTRTSPFIEIAYAL